MTLRHPVWINLLLSHLAHNTLLFNSPMCCSCSVLQCVAARCSVSKHPSSARQNVAILVQCSAVQCIAVHCSTLQHVAARCSASAHPSSTRQHVAVAVCCSVLQCAAISQHTHTLLSSSLRLGNKIHSVQQPIFALGILRENPVEKAKSAEYSQNSAP